MGKICEKGETNSSEEELVSRRIMASAGNGYIEDLPSGGPGADPLVRDQGPLKLKAYHI